MDNLGELRNTIERLTDGVYPFHMPGHKRNSELLGGYPLSFDITEIDGADNLMQPTGMLADLEARISSVFGAHKSFISVNGSTAGIIASILTTVGDGDAIICARNSHRALYSGLILSGAKPLYYFPMPMFESITPESIESALKDSNAKAVFVTSPTYDGIVSDIHGISAVCKKHNALLIVDEAHGAHLRFHKNFPDSAVDCGADIVIQSLHKTLPAPNPLSVIHVGENVNADAFRFNLNLIQTSSPSYALLTALDDCLDIIEKPNAFNSFVDKLNDFRQRIRECHSAMTILEKDMGTVCGIDISKSIFALDISKLVILPNTMTGVELKDLLLSKHRIELEYANMLHAVALTSIADTQEGFDRLYTALCDIFAGTKPTPDFGKSYRTTKPQIEQVLTPRRAHQSPKTRVLLHESIGHISGGFIIPYPPGIPLLAPGEVITEGIYKHLASYLKNNISVVGISDGGIDIILQ